ncbi:MAG: GNAT family N-acetyltransferase [Acidimicrobiia bacterium]|nr:MAG: GNAT family N-acetyltransferase [Acidimicrobiia bacterium]
MTSGEVHIRSAIAADVAAINRIYNHYITGSHVSFDTHPWSDDHRMAWFRERTDRGYAVLIAERGGDVVGSAWSGPWRSKAAYASSVETTVVVTDGQRGAGIGSPLYQALIDDLTVRGFHRCYAIVALPNDASIALHHRLGFCDIGILDEVGRKDGSYISTLLLELKL